MGCSVCQISLLVVAVTLVIALQYKKLLEIQSNPLCRGDGVIGALTAAECVYSGYDHWECNATYTYKQYNITFENTQDKLGLNQNLRVRHDQIEKDNCRAENLDDLSVSIIVIALLFGYIFDDSTHRQPPPVQLQTMPTPLKSIQEEQPEDLKTPLLP